MLWPSIGRVGVRSPGGVLFWAKCIERLHHFAFNTDGTKVEVVLWPTIYIRDPFLRPKRKKGPTMDPKEGQKERGPSETAEPEEETLLAERERKADEEDEALLARRERKVAASRKRKQTTLAPRPPKKTKLLPQCMLFALTSAFVLALNSVRFL